jgi:hypothetical protein
MKTRFTFIVIIALLFSFIIVYDIKAQGMTPVNINLIPTAETLGKGGYSFSSGMYPYSVDKDTVQPIKIDIGGFFKESHNVNVKSDIWLIPVRITYGISDRLDFMFGGTYSTGDTEKSVSDYYEIGDKGKVRVYPQSVLDGAMGMKYNIQKAEDKKPSLAFGGELQMGYTVDDALIDETLEDSFPFMAVLIYMSGSYDLNMISVHGGFGMFVSSKSVQTNERFNIPLQLGIEIPFGAFSAVVDFTSYRPYSGVGLKNIISGGFRYDITQNAAFNASFASVGGFTIGLTVGGKKREAPKPSPSAPSLF